MKAKSQVQKPVRKLYMTHNGCLVSSINDVNSYDRS
jgi:hypothetical protein